MTVLIIVLQCVIFSGFIWSATKYFKKEFGTKRNLYQSFIQFLGLLQIANALFYNFLKSTVNFNFQVFAVSFYFLSGVYFYWTFLTVKKVKLNFAFSKSNPESIIQAGPYQHLRHPFYFSYICAWVATAFSTDFSLISVLAGSILCILYLMAIKQEELEFSKNSLSKQYNQYKSKTYRIVPFIY